MTFHMFLLNIVCMRQERTTYHSIPYYTMNNCQNWDDTWHVFVWRFSSHEFHHLAGYGIKCFLYGGRGYFSFDFPFSVACIPNCFLLVDIFLFSLRQKMFSFKKIFSCYYTAAGFRHKVSQKKFQCLGTPDGGSPESPASHRAGHATGRVEPRAGNRRRARPPATHTAEQMNRSVRLLPKRWKQGEGLR